MHQSCCQHLGNMKSCFLWTSLSHNRLLQASKHSEQIQRLKQTEHFWLPAVRTRSDGPDTVTYGYTMKQRTRLTGTQPPHLNVIKKNRLSIVLNRIINCKESIIHDEMTNCTIHLHSICSQQKLIPSLLF